MSRPWSEDEIGALLQRVGTEPIVDIAPDLNRSLDAVYWKLARLGVKPGYVRRGDVARRRRLKEAIAEANLKGEAPKFGVLARRAGLKYSVAYETMLTLLARGEVARQCRYRIVT